MNDADLIKAVAEKVMPQKHYVDDCDEVWLEGDSDIFTPLTDANDRDRVVDRMISKGWRAVVSHYPDPRGGPAIETHVKFTSVMPTGPRKHAFGDACEMNKGRAVCIAALRALGVET